MSFSCPSAPLFSRRAHRHTLGNHFRPPGCSQVARHSHRCVISPVGLVFNFQFASVCCDDEFSQRGRAVGAQGARLRGSRRSASHPRRSPGVRRASIVCPLLVLSSVNAHVCLSERPRPSTLLTAKFRKMANLTIRNFQQNRPFRSRVISSRSLFKKYKSVTELGELTKFRFSIVFPSSNCALVFIVF